jgi:class 3 adenylate cyclase
MLAAVIDRASEVPVLAVVIGCALTLGFGVPITVGAAFAPSLRPIRDLAEGTERVAAGDYSQRLPVVQDDDLNALFDIVVPAVVDAGGHVNKFLGDGALAVFGAPNDLADHADAAVSAAVLIHRLVAERFGGALRIGIGINTGQVIAGTISSC